MNAEESESWDEKIVEFVEKRRCVTFVELQNFLGEESKGDFTISPPEHSNVFFWINMSKKFMDTIVNLFENEKIFFHPTIPDTYVADGGIPTMPLAHPKKMKHYQSPHWLPVVLNTFPHRRTRVIPH